MKDKKILMMLALAAICAFILYYKASFTELFNCDAMEYAEIGRNILRGEGFHTRSVFPIRLAYDGGRRFPYASFRRSPLLPYFESLVFKLLGPRDLSVAVSTGLFYIALAGLVYLLSLALFNRRNLAVLSAAFFILNGTSLHYAVSGLAEMPFAFFFTAAAYLLVSGSAPSRFLWAGVALGAAQLTRPNGILFILPMAAAVAALEGRGARIRSSALMVIGFITAALPFFIYNFRYTGNPLFSLFNYDLLMETKFSIGTLDTFRAFEKLDVLKMVLSNPSVIIKKSIYGMYWFQNTFPQLLGRYFTAFFIISIFRYHRDKRTLLSRAILYASILAQAVFSSVTLPDIRYCFAFVPAMIVFAAEAVVYIITEANQFLRRNERMRNALLCVTVAALLAPTAIQTARNIKRKFFQGENPGFYTPAYAYAATGEMVKRHVPKGDFFVVSDIAWVSAWYGDRLSIKLPHRISDLRLIEERTLMPVKAILLSSDGEYWGEYNDEWEDALRGRRIIPGYRLVESFSDKYYDAVLFMRK